MRLYNPKYGKETKKELRVKKARTNAVTTVLLLIILAAIAGLICCIVFKAAWYFYLADIGGGLVLFFVFGALIPNVEKEYIDFHIEESQEEYVARSLIKLTPEKVMTGVMQRATDTGFLSGTAYKGIWHGIAVCECGHIHSLKDIEYEIENRSSSSTSSDNGNMYFYETADIHIVCHCSKCGKDDEGYCYNVKNSTGSITVKHELFSDRDTRTTKSNTVDYAGYIETIYNEDLRQYKADCKKYDEIQKQKRWEFERNFQSHREKELREIERLRAKGWYEK